MFGLNLCTTRTTWRKKMSRTAFTLLITCVLTLIASTKGYLGAAEPSEPETAETTQSSSRKTLLSLSGGGMFAHTTHSGIIKGMLDNSYPRGDLRSTGYQWGNAINARYAGTYCSAGVKRERTSSG